MKTLKHILTLAAIGATAATATAQVTATLDASRRGSKIGDLHYGIFYEEINHAGDGGLYAELVRNRSFEDNTSSPEFWSTVGNATMALTSSKLMPGNDRALDVTFKGAGDGISNTGYWGMNAVKDRQYDLSFHVRGSWDGTITATLCDAAGKSLGSVDVPVKATDTWQKVTAKLTATGSAPQATLRLTASKAGSLTLDCVSLFPPTYKNRPNGCRPDLAEMLEAMKPGFVRFPGGCYVEGQNSGTGRNRFEWKKTIGPIENRPGHWNQNWGYRSTDGLGFHELLQLTEDLGAEPLFVVNIGMGHDWKVAYNEIGEFIQEALDAIEYCNGDVNTTWGAVRAANGHPEPFGLRLLEIGNENYQADANQQSDHYAERYKQFYDAIKARHPEITLIGNVEAWGTDNPSWRNSYPCEVVDEHYYRNPTWFENQYNKYDNYDRSRPKVYAGEYAVTSDFGTNGHLTAALGEAVYMLGMENNADVCVMNSYAPIFVNENDQKWKPDMIRFNSIESYGTPSYHVQQLMATLHGKQNIARTESGNLSNTGHKIGLSSWSTAVSYDNVKVTDALGNVIFTDDFSKADGRWSSTGGSWNISGGTLNQTDASMQGRLYVADINTGDSYTLELDATKKSGAEAFLIAFNYGDESNYCWWNIGGWGNTNHAIEVCTNGSKSNYDQRGGSIETGRTYRVKIEVNGASVKCYLDGELVHDITLPVKRRLYMASSIDSDNDMLYLKVVNTGGSAVPLTVNMTNASFVSVEDVTVLASAAGTDENTVTDQTRVAPAQGAVESIEAGKMVYTVPAYSLNILRVKLSDVAAPVVGGKPSAEAEAEVREALRPLELKLKNLHATTALPTSTPGGVTLEWTIDSKLGGLEIINGNWSATLSTPAPGDKAVNGGTLTAHVTYPGGEQSTIDFPVTMAATDGMYGYLYCYMKSNKEITNFALGSREDAGKTFHHLLNGEEIFDTEAIASIEKGTRDAYLGRGERADEYFITTTDMCNAKSGAWNNYGLDLIRSTDLIHWEGTAIDFRKGKSVFSDPEATTDAYRTDAEYAKINRVWAPQWIWDPTAMNGQGAYLVYYSLLSSNSGDNHDRIFYSYADKDFKTLTQPRLFYDPGYAVIDADIVLNPYDGLYHMAIKHEGAGGANNGQYILTSDKLVGGTWKEYLHVTNEGSEYTEGATMVRRIDEDAYNLYYMRYSGGNAYKVCDLDHLCDNVGSSVNLAGTGNFQHGSVITVTEDEYTVLQGWSDLLDLMAVARATDTHAYDKALEGAEKALSYRTVAQLAIEIPKAIQALKAAKEDYVKELINPEGWTDLTSLLVNPNFTNGGSGWKGTGFTAASQGVAEHWNKTFDTYQVLEYMPAGKYRFSCSGFYRYGGKEGYSSHADGSEELLAMLYLNDSETPFMSLFDDSTPFTNSPYNFPDNVTDANKAFNSQKLYGDNVVYLDLPTTGDIRAGFRKTVEKGSDWTCFDNFKLEYSPEANTGLTTPAYDAYLTVDVYTTTGVLVRESAPAANPTEGLAPGIYIAAGRKYVVK